MNNNFFSPSLSEKLAKKGLKSGSDWYFDENGKLFFWQEVGSNPEYEPDWDECYPSFSLQDIFEPENSVKLFPSEKVTEIRELLSHDFVDEAFGVSESCVSRKLCDWQYQSHRLLDLYQSNGLEAVEAELEKGLK